MDPDRNGVSAERGGSSMELRRRRQTELRASPNGAYIVLPGRGKDIGLVRTPVQYLGRTLA